jgi:hypothetical protein
MAIDTLRKREAALAASSPARRIPVPDGTVGQGDREQLLGQYRTADSEATTSGDLVSELGFWGD